MLVRRLLQLTALYLVLLLPVHKSHAQACTTLTVSVTNPGVICQGSTAYFEADISISDENGTQYTWYKNGIIVQQGYGSYSYVTSALDNGDKIQCKVNYSGSICVTGSPATSNIVTASITATQTPSMFIEITSGTTFCEGSNVTFEAVGGNLSNFHWTKNNVSVGTNNFTYTTNQFTTGDLVAVTADVSGSCLTTHTLSANTSGIPITIKQLPNTILTLSGSTTICSTCATIISVSPTGTGYSYQWFNDGTLISGANSSSYTTSNQGVYNAVVTKDGCSKTSSNSYNVAKNVAPSVSGGSDQTIIYPANTVTLYGSAVDPEGASLTFSWTKISGPAATLSGANTATLQIVNLSIGSYIFRITASDGLDASYTDVNVIVTYPLNNYNYIRENSLLVSGVKSADQAASLNIAFGERTESTKYFDGLGRESQIVSTQGSVSKNDIIQPIEYDAFDRESRKYLPYTDGNNGWYKTDALGNSTGSYESSKQYAFYQSDGNLVASDLAPYMQTIFEVSALNRVEKQGAVGQTWQPQADQLQEKTINKSYELNGANDVLKIDYDVNANSIVVNGSYYPQNRLTVNRIIDEHKNDVIEYIDTESHVVCKKVQYGIESGAKVYAETYYIYNDLGDLVFVLPPEAVVAIKSSMGN